MSESLDLYTKLNCCSVLKLQKIYLNLVTFSIKIKFYSNFLLKIVFIISYNSARSLIIQKIPVLEAGWCPLLYRIFFLVLCWVITALQLGSKMFFEALSNKKCTDIVILKIGKYLFEISFTERGKYVLLVGLRFAYMADLWVNILNEFFHWGDEEAFLSHFVGLVIIVSKFEKGLL